MSQGGSYHEDFTYEQDHGHCPGKDKGIYGKKLHHHAVIRTGLHIADAYPLWKDGKRRLLCDSMNAYALSMGLVMNIGMCGIYCTSLLLAEEKEKKTLRVLMTSSVNGMEYFIGCILPVFTATVILNYVLMPVSGYIISGKNLVLYSVVTILSSLISCIIGMLLGIFAKNQVSAGTITTPVLLVLMMVPMFSNFIEILSTISKFFFTGILMDMIMDIAADKGSVLQAGSVVIMVVEAVLAVGLFVVCYRRNGFERD